MSIKQIYWLKYIHEYVKTPKPYNFRDGGGDTPIAPSKTPLQVEEGICIAILNA